MHTHSTHFITRSYRITQLILHVFIGFIIAGALLPLTAKANKNHLIQWWCAHLLHIFNFNVTITGHRPPLDVANIMVVCNHVSWLDIHAINSAIAVRFISKSDIQHWPVIGYFAKQSNTLFLDRTNKKDAKRIVNLAAYSLAAGDRLCLFPEGTTTDGTYTLPFNSSLLEAAIEAKATIWPLTIRYPLPNGEANTRLAYAGETTLLDSIKQILAEKSPALTLHFLDPMPAANQVRAPFAKQLHQLVTAQLKF